MGQGDIHLYQASLFSSSSLQWATNTTRPYCQHLQSGLRPNQWQQFSNKWPFLLQVISCLLLLLKKAGLSFSSGTGGANTFHISLITYGQLVCMCVWSWDMYSMPVHMCISAGKTAYIQYTHNCMHSFFSLSGLTIIAIGYDNPVLCTTK